jgi:hypothetical protein
MFFLQSVTPHSPLSEGGAPNALNVHPASRFVTQGGNRFYNPYLLTPEPIELFLSLKL